MLCLFSRNFQLHFRINSLSESSDADGPQLTIQTLIQTIDATSPRAVPPFIKKLDQETAAAEEVNMESVLEAA